MLVGFAATVYRAACELSAQWGRSNAVLRCLSTSRLFTMRRVTETAWMTPVKAYRPSTLGILAHDLLNTAAYSSWEYRKKNGCYFKTVSCEHVFMATRGSRPGDGLADIIFGAHFSVALNHIVIGRVCAAEGTGHRATGELILDALTPSSRSVGLTTWQFCQNMTMRCRSSCSINFLALLKS